MAAENNAGEIRLGVGLSTDPLQEQAKSVEKTAEKVGKSIGEAVDKGSTETLKKTSEKIGKTAEKLEPYVKGAVSVDAKLVHSAGEL